MFGIGWKVGGKQGEGIDSTGDIWAIALHRMGYYVFTYRHFMSLIKGGHTNYKVRIADQVIRHHGDQVHLLIAFDQTTIDHNLDEMVDGGIVIYDSSSFAATTSSDSVHLCGIPLTDLAKEAGNPIMKNLVAIGVSAAVLGLQPIAFQPVIEDKFGKKGDTVVQNNLDALMKGYEFYRSHFTYAFRLPDAPPVPAAPRLYASGNQAAGFGALAGGCKMLAAYPITPATEIMYWLIEHLPKHGGVVVQAEDEIAAVNMAIGANFTGVRAMTSTSGPGFSLMMEALGLAGMSETPLVIVDVQRGGPSTGLPTKTEQSDLLEALFGTHGDMERIVLTPRTVEECFLLTANAFNLAEVYQCPVIVLSDLYLGMSAHTIDAFPVQQVEHNRGKLLQDEDVVNLDAYAFQRYDATVPDGISPRSLPGQVGGRYVALGNEHNGIGVEVEDVETRMAQVAKRSRKFTSYPKDSGIHVDGDEHASFALIGFGSTYGVLEEARTVLAAEGHSIKHIHFSRVSPFPTEAFMDAMAGVQRALVTELNVQGQLKQWICQHTEHHDVYASCLKYDGDPILLHEVLDRAHAVVPMGVAQR